MKNRIKITILLFALTLLFLALAGVAMAASVTPTLIPGASNDGKTCAEVMPGTIELKIDPVPDGTINQSDGYLSVTVVKPSPSGNANSFDWTASYKVLGVIVKNGNDGANWYDYRPLNGITGDTDLRTPLNGDKGISHISFCYKPALVVTKDARTAFTRTFSWDIDKSVTPAAWHLFRGDSGTSEYTVQLTKTGYTDSSWAVNGTITIHNPHPTLSATIESVSDSLGGIPVYPACGVTFPYTLAAGGTLTCSYSAGLPDGSSRTNTATVATSGPVDGGTGTADVIFGDPTTVVNGSVTVTDTNAAFGSPKTVSASTTWKYSRTFTCDGDEGRHDNTAAITETGQHADASVEVNCYALEVTKNARTSFKRTYHWTIDKSADQTSLTLALGQQFEVNYSVTVEATYTDGSWAVSDGIVIRNPAPVNARINSVTDVVSPDIAASVTCTVSFPHTLPAGSTMSCSYSADLPDASNRTNTATATLQNYAYDKDGVGAPSGTTNFSGSAAVDFSKATMTEVDKCIEVSDTYVGPLGTVCYGVDTLPKTFTYSRMIGPYNACGDYTVDNTATFMTNDTKTTGSDSWSVAVHVPCPGCTLTQGYWKTHSSYGPAPYDDTWASLMPNGEDTTFYLSGNSYYDVLWTNPRGGNAYYILAHQYIAAVLNQLNGAASTPEVNAALVWARQFFTLYTPTTQLSRSVRATALNYAFLLDQYNNGYTGPGHCSESDPASLSLFNYFDRAIFIPLVRR